MEFSQWFHPSFIIAFVVALIGLVAWFIRLESKINANSDDAARIHIEIAAKAAESKAQRDATEVKLYQHLMDEKRHYNEQFFNEFRNTLDNRFRQLDSQLLTISNKIDHLSSSK